MVTANANMPAPGKTSTRLPVKPSVMRQLMFASGGRCAMTDCGLPLVSPTGGWIGTVAHIIGAEKDGPRGADSASAEERRSFDNLLLMCATHGRDVDAPETGEKFFPIDKLRTMKAAHETKISDAVARAIEDELSGVRTGEGLLDTSLRASNAATTAQGLAESMMFADEKSKKELLKALEEARSRLQRLSQPALDALSQILGIWLLRSQDHKRQTYEFGDPGGPHPRLPISTLDNRLKRGVDQSFDSAKHELMAHGLFSVDADEYDQDYVLHEPWALLSFKFWICAASFLYEGHAVEIQEWIKTLDFTIFDREAPAGRDVPWR